MTIKVANAKTTAKIIEAKLVEINERIDGLTGSDNPQVVEARKRLEIEGLMLKDVLDSLKGNHINLKISLASV